MESSSDVETMADGQIRVKATETSHFCFVTGDVIEAGEARVGLRPPNWNIGCTMSFDGLRQLQDVFAGARGLDEIDGFAPQMEGVAAGELDTDAACLACGGAPDGQVIRIKNDNFWLHTACSDEMVDLLDLAFEVDGLLASAI